MTITNLLVYHDCEYHVIASSFGPGYRCNVMSVPLYLLSIRDGNICTRYARGIKGSLKIIQVHNLVK